MKPYFACLELVHNYALLRSECKHNFCSYFPKRHLIRVVYCTWCCLFVRPFIDKFNTCRWHQTMHKRGRYDTRPDNLWQSVSWKRISSDLHFSYCETLRRRSFNRCLPTSNSSGLVAYVSTCGMYMTSMLEQTIAARDGTTGLIVLSTATTRTSGTFFEQ